MAPTQTRILVLGAVLLFEPVNGYQVRRELLSWGVDQWGSVNPGSIYSMLTTQTRQGNLERHDLPDGQRAVAVYTSTAQGRAHFDELVRSALVTVRPLEPLAFQTAASFTAVTDRSTYAACLGERVASLERALEVCREEIALGERGHLPPHVPVLIERQYDGLVAELAWVRRFLARVEGGEFDFAGEARSWDPAEDDPGWQMHADRERYLELLGRRAG